MFAELPVRHVLIGEPQLKQLQKNVWSNRFVQGSMVSEGTKKEIRVRYRGGHTRDYPKRSYEVVRGGKTYHYNAEYDDPSMIRNALSFRFFEWIGVPCPQTRHCLLRLNGQNLGVYLEIEGVDHYFFRRRGISVQSLFYAVNDNANFSLYANDSSRKKSSLFSGYKQMIGSSDDRSKFTWFIRKLNTLGSDSSKALLSYLQLRLDIDNYLRWLAGAVLTGNYDGFDQNYAIYRHRKSQKYRIIPWDYEGTWGRNCFGKPCGSDLVRVTGYNRLTRTLLKFPAVRSKYKKLLAAMLNDPFTVRKIIPVAHAMHNAIRPHVVQDTARKWSVSEFEDEVWMIRRYIEERRRLVADALRDL
ncbi:CotH kinase family protein [Paenibacillus elgii]